MKTDRGMVLISVLWVILVLSLVSFSLASAVRVELSASQQSFDSERAFFMAQGAAEVVYAFYSTKKEFGRNTPVRFEENEYIFPFDSGEARVKIESAGGLIDINAASDVLLASLFDSLGVRQEHRNRLVDSILDWRDNDDIPHLYGAEISDYDGALNAPRNGNFQSVDEVLAVKNMTPQIFHGSVTFDPTTQQYRRIPGLRSLITVDSGHAAVHPNLASEDVLSALPGMNRELAQRVALERQSKLFASSEELVSRVPGMFGHPALRSLTFENASPTMVVSRAALSSSGTSRTVRLLFTRQEKTLIYFTNPLFFRKVEEFRRGRWRFE